MIKVTDVIIYLRSVLSSEAWRVDSAATLFAAEDRSRLQLPCFYVQLGTFTATTVGGIMDGINFRQFYDERIKIIFGCPNVDDATGKYAQEAVYYARNALFAALLNKPIAGAGAHNLQYAGDSTLDMDKARYWHQFEFSNLGELGPDDGYQDDFGAFTEFFADWEIVGSDPLDLPNAQDDVTIEQV